ncbi:MAG: hypothetical protein QM778_29035 [Myxococcales bacterium]
MALTLTACGSTEHGPHGENGPGDAGEQQDAAAGGHDANTGDAGADAAAGDAGDEELVPVPQALIDAIAAAANGGDVDLDADGVTDLSVTVEADRRVVKVMVGDKVLLLVTRYFNGTTEKSGDFNLDGAEDYTELELTTAELFSRQTTQDRNYDGTVDFHETYEINIANRTTHTLREVLKGQAFEVEVEGTNDTGSINAGNGCSGDYPLEDSAHLTEVEVVGELRIVQCKYENSAGCVVNTPKGACTKAQVNRILSELTTMFHDEIDELKPVQEVGIDESSVVECLRKRQAPFLEGLINNLANGKGAKGAKGNFNGSRIACGVTCSADSDVRSLGNTDSVERERVNVNMDQDNGELRDTLLHELLHSAGYDGPPGHNDADGNQDDAIYACSRWCTGRSLKSTGADGESHYDMEGMLDMDDCFKCSGTKATREECCFDKVTCSNGCCDHACEADGTCKRDPCNPALNDGDFSLCRLKGSSDFEVTDGSGSCATSVRWVYDSVSGNKVTLVPTGTTDCTLMTVGCSVTPLSANVLPVDGQLVLDYGTSTYTGAGLTSWNITISCPESPSYVSPFKSGWFAAQNPLSFVSGQPLKSKLILEDGSVEWTFEPN